MYGKSIVRRTVLMALGASGLALASAPALAQGQPVKQCKSDAIGPRILYQSPKRQPRATPRGHRQQSVVATRRRRQLQSHRQTMRKSCRQADGREAQQRP